MTKKPAAPVDPAYAAAYCDPKRFPLTTQKNLELKDQKLIDSINRDDIKRMVEEGRPLSEVLLARQKEYDEKAKLTQGGGGLPGGAGPAAPAPVAPPA